MNAVREVVNGVLGVQVAKSVNMEISAAKEVRLLSLQSNYLIHDDDCVGETLYLLFAFIHFRLGRKWVHL